MPSIAYVQKSCVLALNNLLSMPTRWNRIVPDRRHSMPPAPQSASQLNVDSLSSALQTLVTNLRIRAGTEDCDMIEVHSANNDSELIYELQSQIELISPSLEAHDATFASSLVSLLSHFDRLSTMQTTSTYSSSKSLTASSWEATDPLDLFGMLKRQLSDLQIERLSQPEFSASIGTPPVLAVEAALIWHRIDSELEAVVAMCKERTENNHKYAMDTLPPHYDSAEYELYETEKLPSYDESGKLTSVDSSKSLHRSPSVTIGRPMDEKMRLDLENVAMAIDRLYLVAPQLHNQRVELKSSKLEQLERASKEDTQTVQAQGKQKERDMRELENMLELLTKASQRSLSNQSVVLEGGLSGFSEKARRKDIAKVCYMYMPLVVPH